MKKLKLDKAKLKGLMNLDVKDLKAILLKGSNKINSLKKVEKKRTVVAFDIGSTSIKISQGMYYKENLSIDKFIEIPTPKGAISDGIIENKELLISKIGTALKENSISAKEGICTTNSTLIINREVMIPNVEEDEMETVVRYEIQQYLPINLDDYILQMTVIGEEFSDEGKRLAVRAIAYPERMARGYHELLIALHLKPYALDVNYNSLNKLINFVDDINEYEYNPKDSLVFIDMGANCLDVNIYNDGILKFTRIIKAGGSYLDEALNETLNISKNEIETLKAKSINLSDEELDNQNTLVRDTIDEWIDKTEKIIQFYKNKNVGNEVDKIFIYGGTSKLNGLTNYMTLKLGINTTRIKSIPKITLKSNNSSGEHIDNFVNVIGSIIRL
ncbi:pilus assembly protein PilM [Clostridium uliginosum]|uniref:Type IV pilus assembly protein PilM n=1 Tax=Clostridium uliginosum TaxID=119641 RepID=A0A1I1PHT4_9CLOT|nr:pilus assembly protein PilM [Clostridium uliginosum]SFD09226.1 type IV pilus assembly protein PilM [Clostridium uliginosum]